MAPRLLLLCLLALVGAAGCGSDEEEPARAGGGGGGSAATDLVVRVDRDGPDGPAQPKERRIRCAEGKPAGVCRDVARLQAGDLGPTPQDVACTDIFGGPQTAEIRGTLRGEEVAATFTRSDGCEISRWDGVAPVLSQVN